MVTDALSAIYLVALLAKAGCLVVFTTIMLTGKVAPERPYVRVSGVVICLVALIAIVADIGNWPQPAKSMSDFVRDVCVTLVFVLVLVSHWTRWHGPMVGRDR